MKVFYSGDVVDFESSVVALGNFDGLHIAHMKIIESCIDKAKKLGSHSGVLLFDHHSADETGTRNISLIMTNQDKINILKDMGVDFTYFIKFDNKLMTSTPDEFIALLKDKLKIKGICVGYDYRFGYKATGDIEKLCELGEKYQAEVLVTDIVKMDGEVVGSTLIRQFIVAGDVEKASKYLGRNFSLEGEVVAGLQNGRKMNFPTANIDYNKKMVIPKNGVYAGITTVGGVRYKSVINVGNNPTFGAKEITIETHILDFCEDIYGERITIEFVKRLRDERKFPDLYSLKLQIQADVENTKKIQQMT